MSYNHRRQRFCHGEAHVIGQIVIVVDDEGRVAAVDLMCDTNFRIRRGQNSGKARRRLRVA